MTNPITRFKEWRKYKRALKAMALSIEKQDQIQPNENGLIQGVNKKLFDMYALSYMLNLITVMDYQRKYFHK